MSFVVITDSSGNLQRRQIQENALEIIPFSYYVNGEEHNIVKDGGLSLVSNEDLPSFDSNVFSLFQSNSGVSAFSGTTVTKMLTGKSLSVSPYFDELENGINGRSTVKDLETAFQLMYLEFVDPRFDPEEWQNGIDQIQAVLPNLVNQPNYKLQTELYKTL